MVISHLTSAENLAIQDFLATLGKILGDRLASVYFFGSRARGEGNEESDVDLLILLHSIDIKTKHLVWDAANDIFLKTWINISPLVMTVEQFEKLEKTERLIAKNIKSEGILL